MLLHCHSKKWQSSSDDSLKKYSFYQSDIRKTQKPQQKNHDVSVTCVFFLRQLIVYDSAIYCIYIYIYYTVDVTLVF